jgi:hypothetical protein
MKTMFLVPCLVFLVCTIGHSQPPATANENEYQLDRIEDRSKKSHKKTDKITKHNDKVNDKANKQAEKERKDKLGQKKKKEENHKFDF